MYRFTNYLGERITIYGSTFAEVSAKSKEFEKDKNREKRRSRNVYDSTIEELFEKALEYEIMPNVTPSTASSYNKYFKKHIKNSWYGEMKVRKVKPTDTQKFLMEFGQTHAKKTTTILKAIIKHIFDYAVLSELIDYNHVPSVKLRLDKPEKVVESIPDEDLSLFIKYAKGYHYYNLFVLMLNTGIRVSEAIGLRDEDVDFENNIIYIRQAGHRVDKNVYGVKYMLAEPKNCSKRIIPLNDVAKAALIDEMSKPRKKDGTANDNLIFRKASFEAPSDQSLINGNIRAVQNLIKRVEGVEMDFSSHSFRHTFATKCAKNGMPYEDIKKILGHKDVRTTLNVYVSADMTNIFKQMNNINFTELKS